VVVAVFVLHLLLVCSILLLFKNKCHYRMRADQIKKILVTFVSLKICLLQNTYDDSSNDTDYTS
jgi:hypothetical protein